MKTPCTPAGRTPGRALPPPAWPWRAETPTRRHLAPDSPRPGPPAPTKHLLYANFLYSTNANSVPSTSANATSGGARYDHNLNPKLFAFGSGDFSSNALQNLNLRSIAGGGFGWHASKSAKQSFDVLGGIGVDP